jgi:hypothetical protein
MPGGLKSICQLFEQRGLPAAVRADHGRAELTEGGPRQLKGTLLSLQGLRIVEAVFGDHAHVRIAFAAGVPDQADGNGAGGLLQLPLDRYVKPLAGRKLGAAVARGNRNRVPGSTMIG